jgi:hypothetical protein
MGGKIFSIDGNMFEFRVQKSGWKDQFFINKLATGHKTVVKGAHAKFKIL